MGFRLSVRAINSDIWFGDDHKLADTESESIVGNTLKSIADAIKTGLI